MRRDTDVLRTPITVAVAGAAAALVLLSACGSVRLGAAAVSNSTRISTATLTAEVSTLNSAYQADKSKIKFQFPAANAPQQVLSWLLRFQVRNQLAARNGINVTRSEIQASLNSLAATAKQNGLTLTQLAVANGVPPDQLTALGTYQAIGNLMVGRLDGGTLPKSNAALSALSLRLDNAQCRAAASLGIQVNPQFGALDYRQMSVVRVSNSLAASAATASPSASPQLTPHC
ncbi:MAG TPA: hypothetical protein VG253_22505 [Streptosporangiaceae bacterium]|jgi:hypothetical protein|nr:hypothetical protein [Streptosporangiaceae bacterium]